MRLLSSVKAKLIPLILICLFLIPAGCAPSQAEGFAIYLTKANIPPNQMEALSHFDLAEIPILGLKDILAYNPNTHEISLTSAAFDRILNLEVPTSGKSFMACVDRSPKYWGAFWTPISSQSFEGVTIWKPFGSEGSEVIKLELGYPSSVFYNGQDPRNNSDIIGSLKQSGKLSSLPPPFTVDKLPHSMKGYELYSWQEDGQWHFNLITGTNRNKTLEEIISIRSGVYDDWVQIHVVGVEAIKTILNSLPQNEFVFWVARLREEPTTQISIQITLPPAEFVDEIKEFAEQRGLTFTVPTP